MCEKCKDLKHQKATVTLKRTGLIETPNMDVNVALLMMNDVVQEHCYLHGLIEGLLTEPERHETIEMSDIQAEILYCPFCGEPLFKRESDVSAECVCCKDISENDMFREHLIGSSSGIRLMGNDVVLKLVIERIETDDHNCYYLGAEMTQDNFIVDNSEANVQIFYCPFCGKKLN